MTTTDDLAEARKETADATFAVFELQHDQGTFMPFVAGIRLDAYQEGFAEGRRAAFAAVRDLVGSDES